MPFFQSLIDRGLKANEWINEISTLLDGKGGGRAESAQATGNNPAKLAEAIQIATRFAQSKLGLALDPTPAKQADSDGPTLFAPPGSIRGSIALIIASYAGKQLQVVHSAQSSSIIKTVLPLSYILIQCRPSV